MSDVPTGVLLVNTGSPSAPRFWPVRRYLRQFLSDPRIIELPRWLWLPILHGIILNVRPARIARAYRSIWYTHAEHGADGSPLLVISARQSVALQAALAPHFAGPLTVAMGMAYGSPSIPAALDDLRRAHIRRLLVLPLYPQYAASTVGAAVDAVTAALRRWRWLPELRVITHYHDHPGYIAALAASVRAHWEQPGQPDRLIISYHSLPERYVQAGDPYIAHCQETTRLLVDALGLPRDRWLLTFQSPFGPVKWVGPFLEETLPALPAQGVNSVQVLCPGFAADCLETLEEVAVEARTTFLGAGGSSFHYLPALNDTPAHITALADLVLAHSAGWHTG